MLRCDFGKMLNMSKITVSTGIESKHQHSKIYVFELDRANVFTTKTDGALNLLT